MGVDKKKIADELGLDVPTIDELLKDFSSQTEEAIKKLEEAVRGGDFVCISETSHSVKGSSGNLRLDAIYALSKEIEANAKGPKDIGAIAAALERLKAALADIKG